MGFSPNTPLIEAIILGNQTIIDMLLDAGADPNAKGTAGSPLGVAFRKCAPSKKLIEALLDKGAHIVLDVEDLGVDSVGLGLETNLEQDETSILTLAINSWRDPETLELLLHRNPNWRQEELQDALFGAIKIRVKKMVEVMINFDQDLLENELKLYGLQISPLAFASALGEVEIVEFLVDKGANIEWRSQTGERPLMYAAQEGHEAVAEYLVSKRASLEARDKNGKTAYDFACEYNPTNSALAKILRPNHPDKDELGYKVDIDP
ncbi:Ankyrin-3 [Arthrobotrys entomopaga]|nr:Ankyrin-3 [Arthrobotrys entomopaga]